MYRGESENPFLYYSITCVASLVKNISGKRIDITVENCNGFYYNGVKTGFGSSSSTVVCVVASLLYAWRVICKNLSPEDRDIVLSCARDAHFLSQNKSGSGYDILTSIFGGLLFKKEDPAVRPFSFPSSMTVLFSCGGNKSSSTSSFVSKVKEWLSTTDRADVWDRYRQNNDRMIETLCSSPGNTMLLKTLFEEKLEILFLISQLSNVEVVPEVVYKLMKKTNSIGGVIGCSVAGAGGYDSFYCVTEDSSCMEQIRAVWNEFGYDLSTVKVKDDRLSIQ